MACWHVLCGSVNGDKALDICTSSSGSGYLSGMLLLTDSPISVMATRTSTPLPRPPPSPPRILTVHGKCRLLCSWAELVCFLYVGTTISSTGFTASPFLVTNQAVFPRFLGKGDRTNLDTVLSKRRQFLSICF